MKSEEHATVLGVGQFNHLVQSSGHESHFPFRNHKTQLKFTLI